jgi:3-methylfumaryl-CoA hydratase
LSDLRDWIGREERVEDVVSLAHARGLAALLDCDPATLREGDRLGLGWHWIYCNSTVRQSRLAADGHATRGDFLPPVPLPRRMWAGGRLRFLFPLRIGDAITRASTILDVEEKQGKTGALVVVTVEHRISAEDVVAVEEQQTLIYREASTSESPGAAADDDVLRQADWTETFSPTSVALFRFSALTFNSHRIHYDAPYAKEVEGYRGLLVHAPLTALLLLDASVRNGPSNPAIFTYRAISPLLCDEPITLVGRAPDPCSVDLYALAPDGRLAMQALVAS